MHFVSLLVFWLLVAPGSASAQQPKPGTPPAGSPATSGEKWQSDFEATRQVAVAAKLHLLLAFTTADSAGLCAKLDAEVLGVPEFLNEVSKSYLLVRIDLPADESQVPAALRQQNAKLRTKYPSHRLPAIWLCDSYGRAYAGTSYVPATPKAMLAWVEDRRQASIAATAALQKASTCRGIERAQALAEGLQTLDDAIVAANYHKELMEIIQLDASGAAGLKTRFDAIARDAAARPMLVRMQTELQALREQKQWDELEARVEKALGAHPGERWAEQYLSFLKGTCRLEGRQDCAAALSLFESALKLAPRSELAPEVDRLRQVAAAAVEQQKAREEAERKAAEEAKRRKKK